MPRLTAPQRLTDKSPAGGPIHDNMTESWDHDNLTYGIATYVDVPADVAAQGVTAVARWLHETLSDATTTRVRFEYGVTRETN